jgi:hypothetical protein
MDGNVQVGSYIVRLSLESRDSETVEVTELSCMITLGNNCHII